MGLMSSAEFKSTWRELRPVVDEIFSAVRTAPRDVPGLPATKHLDRYGAIVQYIYYVSLVKRFMPDRNARIVDWGGKFGQVTKFLQHYFPNTECYLPIPDEDNAPYWHQRFGIRNVKIATDPAKIDYPDNSVDAVISSGVLEHTQELNVPQLTALKEIRRILRPGGRVFIWNLPCQYGSVEMLNALLRRWHHPCRFRWQQTVDLIEESGLHLEAIEKHEFSNMMGRDVLGHLVGYPNAFITDYYVSRLPVLNWIAQHFTVIAKKS